MPDRRGAIRQSEQGNVRMLAAQMLRDVLARGQSLTAVLQQESALQLTGRDRALLQELCYGVCRFHPRLEALLNVLLKRPLKQRDSDLHVLLLVGIYQLLYLRVADHAAVDATVAAASALGKTWAKGLVNGVLRNLQRQQQALESQVDKEPEAALACPGWLLGRLRKQWPDHWQAIATAANQRPPMTLRVNQARISRHAYLRQLEAANISAFALADCTQGLILQQPCDIAELPGFAEGLVSVQDAGAQKAALLLNPQPGQRILDACAAPGGKTGHILELVNGEAQLTAIDKDPKRLQRVQENLQRLGLSARLLTGDAASPHGEWAVCRYQRILLDVPCSATGVIRRHPDIKVLRREQDITSLAATQAKMLNAMWSLLEPGGMLLYCTCSVLTEENEQQVAAFLQRQADARVKLIDAPWGHVTGVGRQILPGDLGMDGFYYACFEKLQNTIVNTEL